MFILLSDGHGHYPENGIPGEFGAKWRYTQPPRESILHRQCSLAKILVSCEAVKSDLSRQKSIYHDVCGQITVPFGVCFCAFLCKKSGFGRC